MTVNVSKSAFNIREKLSELDKPTGIKGTELMRSETSQEVRDLIGSGRKNIIINGDFQIAQRSTSNNTTGAQSTYHTLDRWMTQIQSGTITESQQSLSSSDSGPWQKGFRRYMRILNQSGIGAGAAQYAEIDQRVEAQDIANSGWDYTSGSSYITLSFWIRASVAQNYIVNMYANDGTTRHFPFEVALRANTWTKVTKSIPGNSGITVSNDNGNGITISFIASYGTNYTSNSGYFDTWNTTGNGLNRWPDMATKWATTTNATFDITGVQLEVGSIATEFEHRPYAEELALCQRYYQQVVGYSDMVCVGPGRSNGTTNAPFSVPLSVPLRASPTINSCNWAVFTPHVQANINNHTPAVTKWDEHNNVLVLQISGLSGMTNGRSLTVFLNSGHALSMNAEL